MNSTLPLFSYWTYFFCNLYAYWKLILSYDRVNLLFTRLTSFLEIVQRCNIGDLLSLWPIFLIFTSTLFTSTGNVGNNKYSKISIVDSFNRILRYFEEIATIYIYPRYISDLLSCSSTFLPGSRCFSNFVFTYLRLPAHSKYFLPLPGHVLNFYRFVCLAVRKKRTKNNPRINFLWQAWTSVI